MDESDASFLKPPFSLCVQRERGFFAFGEKLCQVCIEKKSKFVLNGYFRFLQRKDYGGFYEKGLEKSP